MLRDYPTDLSDKCLQRFHDLGCLRIKTFSLVAKKFECTKPVFDMNLLSLLGTNSYNSTFKGVTNKRTG